MAFEFLPRFGITEPERITFGPRDVPALLVRPDAPGPHPAALIQHGYGAEKSDLLPLALFLASYGFVSLLPDAWGHGERLPQSGPTWQNTTSSDFFLDVARHTLRDAHDALSLLADRPEVRPDKILAGGFSMGAMVALILGTEDDRVAGVVSIAGSPLPDLMGVALFGATLPDDAHCAWASAHDAAANIANLAPKPLLISHGQDDDMVPVTGAKRLYEAARPYYAAYPGRLALMLYPHTHTVTQEQIMDAARWVATFVLDDTGDDTGDQQRAAG